MGASAHEYHGRPTREGRALWALQLVGKMQRPDAIVPLRARAKQA
jgi:hypothetical protein